MSVETKDVGVGMNEEEEGSNVAGDCIFHNLYVVFLVYTPVQRRQRYCGSQHHSNFSSSGSDKDYAFML